MIRPKAELARQMCTGREDTVEGITGSSQLKVWSADKQVSYGAIA